jgi:hypothetical protein
MISETRKVPVRMMSGRQPLSQDDDQVQTLGRGVGSRYETAFVEVMVDTFGHRQIHVTLTIPDEMAGFSDQTLIERFLSGFSEAAGR